jgi:hypothetical protein
VERIAREINEALLAMVSGDCDIEEFAEEFGPDNARSFEELMMLTSDQGFRFNLPSGQAVYVTVRVQ